MTRYWCAIKIFRGGLGGGAPPAYRRSGPSAKNRTGPCKRKDAQGLKRIKKTYQIYKFIKRYTNMGAEGYIASATALKEKNIRSNTNLCYFVL